MSKKPKNAKIFSLNRSPVKLLERLDKLLILVDFWEDENSVSKFKLKQVKEIFHNQKAAKIVLIDEFKKTKLQLRKYSEEVSRQTDFIGQLIDEKQQVKEKLPAKEAKIIQIKDIRGAAKSAK